MDVLWKCIAIIIVICFILIVGIFIARLIHHRRKYGKFPEIIFETNGKIRKNNNDKKLDAERQREDEAVGWCNLIRAGRLGEYLKWLEKRPEEEILNRFLGIINTKGSILPICFGEENPPLVINGIRVDPIENTQARRVTKITLLLIVKSECEKLGIWNKIQPQWTEEFIQENKSVVQIWEALAKRCEDNGQESEAADIRKKIDDIKEKNNEYGIDW